MRTLHGMLYLSFFYLFCIVYGSPTNDADDNSSQAKTDHFVMIKLKEAYNFMFASKTTPKTTLPPSFSEEYTDFDYTTLEAANRFKSIMNNDFLFNKNRSHAENARIFTKPDAKIAVNVTDFKVTEDPILKGFMKPEDVLRQKAQVEGHRERRKQDEQEAASRRPYEMAYTGKVHFSEEYVDSNEGILQKIRRKVPLLKHILPDFNIGDKIVGSLTKTLLHSAKSIHGEHDATRVAETFKEDMSHKGKEVQQGMKETMSHVKDKVIHSVNKMAGALGKKIGELFANYQAQYRPQDNIRNN